MLTATLPGTAHSAVAEHVSPQPRSAKLRATDMQVNPEQTLGQNSLSKQTKI